MIDGDDDWQKGPTGLNEGLMFVTLLRVKGGEKTILVDLAGL
jgi:hypothetical protein